MSDTPASPKLLRLEAEIKSESDPRRKACLRAERAGFLGRQGYFAEAREAIALLQKDLSIRHDAKVAIWIKIAESWIAHYDNQSTTAVDCMKRAHALSAAGRVTDLQSLCAAWLAHFAAGANDFQQMALWIKIALEKAPPDFHAAQTRIALVLALAYHFARRLDLAVPWYAKAREHAFAEGDDGAISSMSFNRAALHTNHALQAAIFENAAPIDTKAAQTAASSTYNFDQLVKTSSLKEWIFMVQAILASVDGNFDRAKLLYDDHLAAACAEGLEHQKSSFLADRAWCNLQLGKIEAAIEDAEMAEQELSHSLYSEDKAVACGRLGQVFDFIKDDRAEKYKNLAGQYWQDHEIMRAGTLEILLGLLPRSAD